MANELTEHRTLAEDTRTLDEAVREACLRARQMPAGPEDPETPAEFLVRSWAGEAMLNLAKIAGRVHALIEAAHGPGVPAEALRSLAEDVEYRPGSVQWERNAEQRTTA